MLMLLTCQSPAQLTFIVIVNINDARNTVGHLRLFERFLRHTFTHQITDSLGPVAVTLALDPGIELVRKLVFQRDRKTLHILNAPTWFQALCDTEVAVMGWRHPESQMCAAC
jgi:hypothetical protein